LDGGTCSVCIIVVGVLGLVGMMSLKFLMFRQPRREDLARDLVVTGEGLQVPGAPKPLREITREMVRSLLVVETVRGPAVRVEADRGVILLPMDALEALRAHGFQVIDSRRGEFPAHELDAQYPAPRISGIDRGDLKGVLVSQGSGRAARPDRDKYTRRTIALMLPSSAAITVVMILHPRPEWVYNAMHLVLMLMLSAGMIWGFRFQFDLRKRAYSNGFEDMGLDTFVPWGVVEGLDEYPEGSYVLRAFGTVLGVINDNLPEKELVFDLARERVADPRYDSREYHRRRARSILNNQLYGVGVSFFLATLFSEFVHGWVGASDYQELVEVVFDSGPLQRLFLIIPLWSVFMGVGFLTLSNSSVKVLATRQISLLPVTLPVLTLLGTFTALPILAGLDSLTWEIAGWYAATYGLPLLYLLRENARVSSLPHMDMSA